MANILISAASPAFDNGAYQLVSFYEGFIRALQASGSNIKFINTYNFMQHPWRSNTLATGISKEKMSAAILDFKPDLIIAFNHSIPMVFLEKTSCPVVIWNVDSAKYLKNTDYIRQNADRYCYLSMTPEGLDDGISLGILPERASVLLPGTAIRKENIEQDKNISFIGTNFTATPEFVKFLKNHNNEKLKPVANAFKGRFYDNYDSILKAHDALWFKEFIDPNVLAELSSCQERISILNEIEELGLTIYGESDWYSMGLYLPWLAMSYNPKKIYSLGHNSYVYNSSKIGINVSHSQAVKGFPWRVMDIMASNACLVSNVNSGINEFTHGFLSIPMYENRRSAYDLCNRLITDTAWRTDLVAASQACVEAKGRWNDRIDSLFKIAGIPDEKRFAKPADDGLMQRAEIQGRDCETLCSAVIDKTGMLAIRLMPKILLVAAFKILAKLNIRLPYKLTATARGK